MPKPAVMCCGFPARTADLKMFVPISDKNPLKIISFQWVTVGIIAVNILVFLYYRYSPGATIEQDVMFGYGMIPAVLFDSRDLAPNLVRIPDKLTLITYQFFHGGWMHLLSNMAFLWVFGDNIEDIIGHIRFLVFYLGAGIFAGLAHAVAGPESAAPLIGASGAVAGVLATYMILHPRQQVWVLLFLRLPVKIPALWAILAWMAFQVFSVFTDEPNQKEAVAWWAHIGGFAAGIPLLFLLAPNSLRRARRLEAEDAET